MKKLVIILMLLVFSVAGVGCYGAGDCPGGVCTEEHSKSTGPPAEGDPEEADPAEEKSGE